MLTCIFFCDKIFAEHNETFQTPYCIEIEREEIMKKITCITLLLALLISCVPFALSVSAAAPDYVSFVFNSAENVAKLTNPHNLAVSYDENENAAKLLVTVDDEEADPYVFLNVDDMNIDTSKYSYLLFVFKIPRTVSNTVDSFETFIQAGANTAPVAGNSRIITITADMKIDKFVTAQALVSSKSFWNGQLHGLRFDCFSHCEINDVMYLDSISVVKDTATLTELKKSRLQEANSVEVFPENYYCSSYDVTKYTAPFWKGDIVYNEAVYPIKDASGNSTYTLMYTPDKVVSVFDAQFNVMYTEGVDYVVDGNSITFLRSGSIALKEYTYLHPTNSMIPAGYTGWQPYYKRHAAGDGKYEYWTDLVAREYINVTYTHSDEWQGPVPAQSSSLLPRTANAITNQGSLNIVYYGDSLCGGARASSYQNLYPYAEYWNQQISSKLSQDYGVNVNSTISAVGGSDAVTMSDPSKVQSYVTNYNPDLVFIEFGVNDAQNYSVDYSSTTAQLKSAYKDAVISIINQIRTRKPNCEFVLIAPYYSNIYDFRMSYFEVCRDALVEIAPMYSGVAVADVTAVHEYLLGFKNYADFTGDNLCHPNDYMSRIYSQVCLEAIVPGGVEGINVVERQPDTPDDPIPDDPTPDDDDFVRGDLNADGKISAVDSNMLLAYLTGVTSIENAAVADLDEDGKTSATDFNLLSRKIAGVE